MAYPLKFKDWRQAGDLDRVHEKLTLILKDVMMMANEWGVEVEITEVYRKDGVHSLWRAIDAVPTNRNTKIMNIIRDEINREWDYGNPPYEVIPPINHNPQSEPHWHIQVRDETIERP
jgi:hypothetical protein